MSDPDAGLVVRDVRVRHVAVPLRRPLATRVGDFARWPLLLIDIRTEQGITGRGYLGPYLDTAAASVRTMVTELGEALTGHLAAPAAAYRAARGWLSLAGYQGLALAAVAGLDIALWDALAQAAGLPLARLLGGTGEPVPGVQQQRARPDRPGRAPVMRPWNCSPRAGSPRSRSGWAGRTPPTTWRRSVRSGTRSGTGHPGRRLQPGPGPGRGAAALPRAGRRGPGLDRGAAALRRPGRPRPGRPGHRHAGHAGGELLRPACHADAIRAERATWSCRT